MKSKKNVQPNYGFIRQLIEYDVKLFGKESIRFEDYVVENLKNILGFHMDDMEEMIRKKFKECNGDVSKILDTLFE